MLSICWDSGLNWRFLNQRGRKMARSQRKMIIVKKIKHFGPKNKCGNKLVCICRPLGASLLTIWTHLNLHKCWWRLTDNLLISWINCTLFHTHEPFVSILTHTDHSVMWLLQYWLFFLLPCLDKQLWPFLHWATQPKPDSSFTTKQSIF